MSETKTYNMKLDKVTKNACRYATDAEGAPPAVKTLYVSTWGVKAEGKIPASIVVTMTPGEKTVDHVVPE